MALIKCSECNNEVSDKAISCPKCGAPIANNESIAAGANLNTIQETSKKFKFQSFISLLIAAIGFVLLVSSEIASDAALSLFTIGMVWYIVNQVRIWWHHK